MSVQFLEARACQHHDLGEPVFGDGVLSMIVVPRRFTPCDIDRIDQRKLDANEGTEKQQAPPTSESLEARHKSTLSQQERTPITQSFKHKATTNNQIKVPELEQHPQGASTEQ